MTPVRLPRPVGERKRTRSRQPTADPIQERRRALDPQDCVGGALLEAVRRRAGLPEPDDEGEPALPATGPLAWSRLSPV